jgi:hypothetical protein
VRIIIHILIVTLRMEKVLLMERVSKWFIKSEYSFGDMRKWEEEHSRLKSSYPSYRLGDCLRHTRRRCAYLTTIGNSTILTARRCPQRQSQWTYKCQSMAYTAHVGIIHRWKASILYHFRGSVVL